MQGDHHGTLAVYDDLEALSLAAAGLFAVEARRAAQEGGRFDVLLCGGGTPRRCYQLLGQEPLRDTIPWEAVHLFFGDERYVPHDDPLSNYKMVREALLQQVPLRPEQIHPVPFEATPAESSAAYQRALHSHFDPGPPRFHLALLGLGENGHTASLFPGTPPLAETERWVCDLYIPEEDLHRITVTPPVLNASAAAAFLVSGAAKAEILRQVLQGSYDPQRIPAQLVHPEQGRLLWLVDRDAARLLSRDSR